MTLILIWISAAIRLVIPALVTFKLIWRFHRLNRLERAGLALAGGSSLLTVPPMLLTRLTPFDDWSGLVFGLGFLVYLIGKLERDWAHP